MARKKQSTSSKKKVTSTKHKDKRKNIPTQELGDFVKKDEESPQTLLYPRDPSLDPQLVWKGKDEQDRHDLEVPLVPVYIQEKIHPQAIIEDLRAHAPSSVGAFRDTWQLGIHSYLPYLQDRLIVAREGGGTHGQDASSIQDDWRHSQGFRVQTGTPYHAQVHRQ